MKFYVGNIELSILLINSLYMAIQNIAASLSQNIVITKQLLMREPLMKVRLMIIPLMGVTLRKHYNISSVSSLCHQCDNLNFTTFYLIDQNLQVLAKNSTRQPTLFLAKFRRLNTSATLVRGVVRQQSTTSPSSYKVYIETYYS